MWTKEMKREDAYFLWGFVVGALGAVASGLIGLWIWDIKIFYWTM